MSERSKILNYLEVNKDRFMREYHLTKIGLFGSMGRAVDHELSDIDIVIEFEPGTLDLYSLKLRLKSEIQEKFNRPVDICRLKYIKPVFRSQIQRDVKYV